MGFDKFKSIISSAIYEEVDGDSEQQTQTSTEAQKQTVVNLQPNVAAAGTVTTPTSDVTIASDGSIQYTGKVREKLARLMHDEDKEGNITGQDTVERRAR